MADVIVSGNDVNVVVELPWVEKKDVKVRAREGAVETLAVFREGISSRDRYSSRGPCELRQINIHEWHFGDCLSEAYI